MPEFTYAGLPRAYPEFRDADDVIVGPVEDGDVRAFEAPEEDARDSKKAVGDRPSWYPAPDEQWIPAKDAPKGKKTTAPDTGKEEG